MDGNDDESNVTMNHQNEATCDLENTINPGVSSHIANSSTSEEPLRTALRQEMDVVPSQNNNSHEHETNLDSNEFLPSLNDEVPSVKNQSQDTGVSDTNLEGKTADNPEEICRICNGDDSEEPFISPCKCKGSMKSIHKSCLELWLLETFKKNECELCKTNIPVVFAYKSFYKFVTRNTGKPLYLMYLMWDVLIFYVIIWFLASVCFWFVKLIGFKMELLLLQHDISTFLSSPAANYFHQEIREEIQYIIDEIDKTEHEYNKHMDILPFLGIHLIPFTGYIWEYWKWRNSTLTVRVACK